ncbi:DUF1036 domain-containing protein [Terrihabitans sp. B22-R8]|uniref:DUF1036 domain-containing protein n=1 Tax=Terrihabitans sp. B22-R8 TaxID=3425128 RepID=UPI00403D0B3D
MTSIFAPRRRAHGCKPFLLALGVGALSCVAAPAAWAVDFRLCNATPSRVGISIGYKDGETWVTEGWWNVAASSCETLLKGPLVARFYYVYAMDYDRGGEWGGTSYMCTREKEFTIRGVDNCLARGFARTGFFEIDTKEQRSWTVQLTDSPGTASKTEAGPETGRGATAAASPNGNR